MRRIFKYRLKSPGATTLSMPRGAEVLGVQLQAGDLAVWAMVDPALPPEDRRLVVVGTGHQLPDSMASRERYPYLGTVQASALVWHVFEEAA